MFNKHKQPAPDRAQAAHQFRLRVEEAITAAIISFVDRRDLADALESMGQRLRVQHANTAPIR